MPRVVAAVRRHILLLASRHFRRLKVLRAASTAEASLGHVVFGGRSALCSGDFSFIVHISNAGHLLHLMTGTHDPYYGLLTICRRVRNPRRCAWTSKLWQALIARPVKPISFYRFSTHRVPSGGMPLFMISTRYVGFFSFMAPAASGKRLQNLTG